jgi:hypothetical protein
MSKASIPGAFNKVAGSSAPLLWNPSKADRELKFYDGNTVVERPGGASVSFEVQMSGRFQCGVCVCVTLLLLFCVCVCVSLVPWRLCRRLCESCCPMLPPKSRPRCCFGKCWCAFLLMCREAVSFPRTSRLIHLRFCCASHPSSGHREPTQRQQYIVGRVCWQ